MNKNKSLPLIIGSIVIAVVAIMVFAQNSKNNTTEVENTYQSSTPSETITPSNDEKPVVKEEPTPAVKSYTMAEVATHNNTASCWTAINGGVYDVTSWISKHPGGKQAIMGTCGKDASAYFNGQHGGQPQPISTLATFKIGMLTK